MSKKQFVFSVFSLCVVGLITSNAHAAVWGGGGSVRVGFCAPEMEQKGAEKLGIALRDAAAQDEFKSSQPLHALINDAAKVSEPHAQLKVYLSAVGVDADNVKQVSKFLGARDFAPYIEAGKKSLQFTDKQAEDMTQLMRSTVFSMIE